MKKLKENPKLFIGFVVCTILGFCTNFISFVSPYWIQSIPSAHSQFQRIGLWTVCFDGYMRPNMYNRAYFGCYYIYYVIYDEIRDWLNPAWFYAIQCSSSLGIFIQFLVLYLTLNQVTEAIPRTKMSVLIFGICGNVFACLAIVASLVAFAVVKFDSRWMPTPQMNVLSWAYAVAALSFVLNFAAFVFGFSQYLHLTSGAMLSTNLLENENSPFLNVEHDKSTYNPLGKNETGLTNYLNQFKSRSDFEANENMDDKIFYDEQMENEESGEDKETYVNQEPRQQKMSFENGNGHFQRFYN